MTQAIDYNALTDNLVGFLNSVNTTTSTYDLSLSLDNRISSVIRDDLTITPKLKPQYPIVSVRLEEKKEENKDFNMIKQGRLVTLNYGIYLVLDSFNQNVDNQILVFIRNVEANLRNYVNFNGYNNDVQVLFCLPRTMFKMQYGQNQSRFNQAAKIDLDVICYLDDARFLHWDIDTQDNYYGDTTQ